MRAYGSVKRHNRYTGDDRALVPDVRLARERRLNRLGENHRTQDDQVVDHRTGQRWRLKDLTPDAALV